MTDTQTVPTTVTYLTLSPEGQITTKSCRRPAVLSALQQEVGGQVEVVNIGDPIITVWVNEEALCTPDPVLNPAATQIAAEWSRWRGRTCGPLFGSAVFTGGMTADGEVLSIDGDVAYWICKQTQSAIEQLSQQ